jgi:hypothetical protein
MPMDPLAAAFIAVEENLDELRGVQGERGVPGDRGPKGDTGEPGPKGDRGDPGQRGDTGARGDRGPMGTPGIDGQPGIVWRGPWNRNTAYQTGDAVELDGSSWIAKGDPGPARPPRSPWDLIAKKGEPGLPGRPGGGGGGGGGSGASDLDAVLALSGGQDIADALTGAAAPSAANVFATMADAGGGTPTLAEVLAEGNDTGGATIGTLSTLLLNIGTPPINQYALLRGGQGGVGEPGGTATLAGGSGDGDNTAPAEINAFGGGATTAGRISIVTDAASGNAAQVLTAQGDGSALWADPTGGPSPGVVPIGGIIMWSGPIATIPVPDWQLCDGTANTPGPDLRDKFVVGATADDAGVAKTNIEGTLKASATQTGASIADHSALSHSGGAVSDHTGLSHDGGVASHPDLTHAALSHAALTIAHADHSVASATHSHASGADVSVASLAVASALASRPAIAHTHASGADISIASQAIASGVDISIASLTGASSTGAAVAGVLSFATSTNRSGITGLASHTHASHTHAAHTGSRPSLAVAAVTGSRPALAATDASGADVSVPGQTIASTLGSRPTLSGSQAAVTLAHADHSVASLSHQAIGTHTGLSHAFTPPASHGTAGTLTHAFTQPSAHTVGSHSTVAIVPAYFALAYIQRMA